MNWKLGEGTALPCPPAGDPQLDGGCFLKLPNPNSTFSIANLISPQNLKECWCHKCQREGGSEKERKTHSREAGQTVLENKPLCLVFPQIHQICHRRSHCSLDKSSLTALDGASSLQWMKDWKEEEGEREKFREDDWAETWRARSWLTNYPPHPPRTH